jgi:mono/diheme cytochrome c family protein
MRKSPLMLMATVLFGMSLLGIADEIDGGKLFKRSCVVCHTDRLIDPSNKGNLIGPPADEVLMHVKEKFPDKTKAIAFMTNYIMKPDANKALCASMDKFGLMPSMEGVVSTEEARAINSWMFDQFPRSDFEKKETKTRSNITFETIDTNGDGGISPEEFKNFRAKKNGIDPAKFKHDLYFKRIDTNGDGKMDRDEFRKMREAKAGKK